jgi:transketolase
LRKDIDDYCKPNVLLGAHPDYETSWVAASPDSFALGLGLGMATGQAYAEKLKGSDALSIACFPMESCRKAQSGRR